MRHGPSFLRAVGAVFLVGLGGCSEGPASTPSSSGPPRDAPAAPATTLAFVEPLFRATDPVDRPSGVAVSADGSAVVFATGGRVTPDDLTAADDVFIYAPATQAITCVTCRGQGPSYLEELGVSADGRRILFTTSAVLAADDGNEEADVYLADRADGSVTRVSLGSGGREIDGDTLSAAISGSGGVVAFATRAGGVVPGDREGTTDVFVRELASGALDRASVGPGGTRPADDVYVQLLGLSEDGARVAFLSSGILRRPQPAEHFQHEVDLYERGSKAARLAFDLRDLNTSPMAADARTIVGTRPVAETTVAVRVDLTDGAETTIASGGPIDALAISPDGHVVAMVAWVDGARSLQVFRDGAIASTNPLSSEINDGRPPFRSFAVANDGTVVARLEWRRARGDGWTFSPCVAILAPRLVNLACGAPADHEEL